jgi:DNA-binding Lrp family transcriptional regulator
MKLSSTEQQVLGLLHFQAQMPLTEVARHIGAHLNTVIRALDRLKDRSVVRPTARVNIRALGYKVYNVWCLLSDVGIAKLSEITANLHAHPNVIFAARVCGDYDLLIDFAIPRDADIEDCFSRLALDSALIFANTSIVHSNYWYSFPKQFYFDTITHETIPVACFSTPTTLQPADKLDLRLIEHLSDEPLITQRELGLQLDTPLQTINYRLARLHRAAILMGNELSVNHLALGLQAFTLLIKINFITSEIEQSLLLLSRNSPNVVGCGRRSGEWNFELLIEVEKLSDLQRIRFELRKILGMAMVDSSLLVIESCITEKHQVYSSQSLQSNAL